MKKKFVKDLHSSISQCSCDVSGQSVLLRFILCCWDDPLYLWHPVREIEGVKLYHNYGHRTFRDYRHITSAPP